MTGTSSSITMTWMFARIRLTLSLTTLPIVTSAVRPSVSMGEQEYVVQMKGITKVYPNGVAANQGVDFNVKRGEIHALMGENGAGKSTLMKMLFGLEQPT